MNDWSILIRTAGGGVTYIRDLSETEARAVMRRLPGRDSDPWSDGAIARMLAQEDEAKRYRAQLAAQGMMQGGSTMFFNASGHTSHISMPDQAVIVSADCYSAAGVDLCVWPKPDDYDERLAKAREVAALVDRTNAEIEKQRKAA